MNAVKQLTANRRVTSPVTSIAEYLALRISDPETIDKAVEKGWVEDSQALSSMSHTLREWSQHPDGIFAQAWCEAVGQKG